MYYKVFSSKTCFPEPVAVPEGGYFSTVGVNVTTNVAVSLSIGDYLYSTSNNELRAINAIGVNGNTFTLASAFTANVISDPGELVQIADNSIIYTSVSVTNIDDVDGLFDGYLFEARTIQDIKDDSVTFTIDGTGTHISILAV